MRLSLVAVNSTRDLLTDAVGVVGGIDAMNAVVAQHLAAKADPTASTQLRQAPEWFEGQDSPIWSRRYSESLGLGKYCHELKWVLDKADVARTVRIDFGSCRPQRSAAVG